MAVSPDTEDRLNVQTVEHGGLTWLNIENPGMVEMQFLKESFSELIKRNHEQKSGLYIFGSPVSPRPQAGPSHEAGKAALRL